ncbi:MAG: acyl carrier protein [Bryobacteraceae bacterium]
MDNVEQRLKSLFEMVFPDLPPAKIESASQESVETWDSAATITLLNLIEEEFVIEMDLDRAAELTSFSKILEYLKERGVQTAA